MDILFISRRLVSFFNALIAAAKTRLTHTRSFLYNCFHSYGKRTSLPQRSMLNKAFSGDPHHENYPGKHLFIKRKIFLNTPTQMFDTRYFNNTFSLHHPAFNHLVLFKVKCEVIMHINKTLSLFYSKKSLQWIN